jgi:hypothetical protein
MILCLCLACWGSAACFSARGPKPIDLSAERSRIARDGLRLQRIRQVVARDLEQLERLRKTFEAAPPGLYKPPFPLDLFKHVAVDCLNEPYEADPDPDSTSGSSNAASAAAPVGWTCTPEYADRLMVALHEKAPEREAAALHKLRTLDELRRLRGKLRYRLGQVPAILRESRRILATRRADLRRMRDAEARRRTEYSGERWDEMQRRFDEFERNLHELHTEIEQLAEVWPTWKPAVEQQISALYTQLTSLSHLPG